ncbi:MULTISPECIES: RNA polymerase sigma factor [Stenotrophomonas]|uniref:RNA polymerase sigma factor n=2 Tax=Stenotrophomonas maltophilia group TaxID=995085 RepID=A0A2J0SM42_STEMA|nr:MULTISPECIES: RNA polymerase sigma factor [Stenotrophomonas]MBA0310789.1 RNA polymerase sigma factor [Stenotrophomonas maltophilia]MBH1407944.1 RNA polymerase sigma factor [Stenotrophomonas maltophilia]MBH1744594.1 RNA polymerase sigma factor [Stenotrophomonas maltophilia]MBH1863763.1 RNA polymerase sigma factor [Stenotrophomonas maltophilia]MDH1387744.1 RNA polymerase sigma factor [Stenotrophomonas sp. GD03701]
MPRLPSPCPPAPPLMSSLVRHYEELVEYLRRRFRSPGLAREVVHDVCVRLLERPVAHDARQPVALLRRIAHDAAVDRCRAEDLRRHWVEGRAKLPDDACPRPGPEQQAQGQQAMQRLGATIERMPCRRQQVFILHKIHELPQAEVARRMGIGLKAVERHLRLAMADCHLSAGLR